MRLPARLHAEGAHLPAVPGRAGAAHLLGRRPASPRSPCRRRRGRCGAAPGRAGDHDRRADGAEHVGHRVGDRHRVEQRLGLVGGQAQPVDGVGREAHRGGDRLRARVEPRRVAEVVAGHLGDRDGDQQAEHALDHREDRLRQAVLGDAADELRPDAVADGEQEHQEDGRLEGLRDRDPDLSDQDAGEQRGGDRPEADALEGELAEVVPDGEREKDRDLRVLAQRRANQSIMPSSLLLARCASPARRASGARGPCRRRSRGSPSRRACA